MAKAKNLKNGKDLTEKEIETQEHLTQDRLNRLNPAVSWDDSARPKADLVDLMHWAKIKFSSYLNDKENVEPYIHNKIIIDGAFLTFAEQENVSIECLYRDAMASWNTDYDNEHFITQGVFKISKKNEFEFIHCALFHKGNQNEDEVSFFVLVDNSHFEKYRLFRNKYDKWLTERDRNQLEIHVVNGEGMPYERNMSWDDLFLPTDLKKNIKQYVESFLKARSFYEKMNIPWKTGCLLWGPVGTGKTSLIRTIISNYNFKPVTVQSGSQTNDDTITEAFRYAEEQEPALLYFEDLDTMLSQSITLSHFLQMMDGVSSKNGIFVIATANDISRLKESVTDRPSRFDRKWEIGLPDFDMAKLYLKKWFKNLLSEEMYDSLTQSAVDSKFSYAYLKELYLASMFNAIANNRKSPNLEDIQDATNQLLKDKEVVKNNFESSSKTMLGID